MFFYGFFPLFSYILIKISIKTINLISIILLTITIISLMFNYFKLFTPWFSFLSLFIIWYYGYLLQSCYVHQKQHDFHFIVIFFISVIICLNKSHIPSDTIYQIAKGLIIVSIIYSLISIYHINRVKMTLSKVENILVFLFYKIGLGSYALYAFHYVILMMCAYFKLTLIETLAILIISVVCCIQLEIIIVKIAARRFSLNRQINKDIYPSRGNIKA